MIQKVEGWMINSQIPTNNLEEQEWNGVKLKLTIKQYKFLKIPYLDNQITIYDTSETGAWNKLREMVFMKPRKKIEGKRWENPSFDKGIVEPLERFWYMCEQKGLQADKEAEEWLYEIINYTYRMGCANQKSAIMDAIENNVPKIFSAINTDIGNEIDKRHDHYNKNI